MPYFKLFKIAWSACSPVSVFYIHFWGVDLVWDKLITTEKHLEFKLECLWAIPSAWCLTWAESTTVGPSVANLTCLKFFFSVSCHIYRRSTKKCFSGFCWTPFTTFVPWGVRSGGGVSCGLIEKDRRPPLVPHLNNHTLTQHVIAHCCPASCRNRGAAWSCRESFNMGATSAIQVSLLPQQRPPFASCLNGLEMSIPWYKLKYTLRSQMLFFFLTRSRCFFTSGASHCSNVSLYFTALPNGFNMRYCPTASQCWCPFRADEMA